MRRIILTFTIFIVAMMLAVPAMAQVSVTAVPFMTIEPGARGNGMGNAFTALADDASGPFWNPAGLAFMGDQSFALLERSPWLNDVAEDMYLAYAGFNQPVSDLGMFSINFHYLNMGTNYYTTSLGPEVIGEFDSFDYALSLGYGTLIQDKIGFGLNVKLIHSHLSDKPAGAEVEMGDEGAGTSFAVDLGLLYKDLLIQGFNLAAVVQNLGPDMSYIDAAQSDPLPRNLRLGMAYKAYHDEMIDVNVVAEANKLLVEFGEELEKQIGSQTITSGGAEIWFMDMFAGRLGYYRDDEGHIEGMTFGGGFQLDMSGYQGGLDFAYIPGGELQDYNKKFSLSLRF